MKYIRTKDGIQALYIDEFTEYGKEYYKNCKIADTIEELCDEFVVIYNESRKFAKPFTSAYCDIKDVLKEHDLSECKIYGAIWSEKGLIYVAKINDKGELELL